MYNKEVYITDVLYEENLLKAIELRANCIICNEIKSLTPIPFNIQVVNAEIYRVEGTWEVYQYNTKLIEELCKKYPLQFVIDKVNLLPALPKITFWTNYRLGALSVAYKKIEIAKRIVNTFKLIPANKLKEIFKYFKNYILNNWKYFSASNSISTDLPKAENGILVNNEFELKLYLETIERIAEKDLIIFYYGDFKIETYQFKSKNIKFLNLSKYKKFQAQPFCNIFNETAEKLNICNLILKDWQLIANEIHQYKIMHACGIKKLLVNVAENLPLRNLMPQVFNGDVQVYNSMNGLKSGEAQDADVLFDKWFVWSEEMANLLREECHIPHDKLIISGHLSQDQIADHQFENSIQIDLDKIKSKKVISLFSVRGHRKEKIDAFRIIYQFLETHPDYYLIVKLHPLEQKEDYIYPNYPSENILFVSESLKNSKVALFDQLSLTDLSIVFGSTVALESSWYGVPCVTYEYKERSFIDKLGNEMIEHIDNEQTLKKRLEKLTKNNLISPLKTRRVSENIAAHFIN